MVAAAARLAGEHDFASFGVNPKRRIDTTVRTLHRLAVVADGPMIYFDVIGDSFLYKMVRSLVGYLVLVGAEARPPHDADRVLAAKDRCAAGDSAPPQGLFLAKVFFGDDEWRDYTPALPPFAGLADPARTWSSPADSGC